MLCDVFGCVCEVSHLARTFSSAPTPCERRSRGQEWRRQYWRSGVPIIALLFRSSRCAIVNLRTTFPFPPASFFLASCDRSLVTLMISFNWGIDIISRVFRFDKTAADPRIIVFIGNCFDIFRCIRCMLNNSQFSLLSSFVDQRVSCAMVSRNSNINTIYVNPIERNALNIQ